MSDATPPAPRDDDAIERVTELLMDVAGYTDEPDESEAHRLYEISGRVVRERDAGLRRQIADAAADMPTAETVWDNGFRAGLEAVEAMLDDEWVAVDRRRGGDGGGDGVNP